MFLPAGTYVTVLQLGQGSESSGTTATYCTETEECRGWPDFRQREKRCRVADHFRGSTECLLRINQNYERED